MTIVVLTFVTGGNMEKLVCEPYRNKKLFQVNMDCVSITKCLSQSFYSAHMPSGRRRQWQPTPVFLPGKSHGWRSLMGYGRWGREDSDTTEHARTYA